MQPIILAFFVLTQIAVNVTVGESYQDMGQIPEIEIEAPRYRGEEADSIGMMPGIIVFGERYAPQDENALFYTYSDYRTSFQSLSTSLQRYAAYILIAMLTLTWGIIVLTRIFNVHHEPIGREKSRKQLHAWVKKQQIKKLKTYEMKKRR